MLLSFHSWTLRSRLMTLIMSAREFEKRARQRLPVLEPRRIMQLGWRFYGRTAFQDQMPKQAGSGRSLYDPYVRCLDWWVIQARSWRMEAHYTDVQTSERMPPCREDDTSSFALHPQRIKLIYFTCHWHRDLFVFYVFLLQLYRS